MVHLGFWWLLLAVQPVLLLFQEVVNFPHKLLELPGLAPRRPISQVPSNALCFPSPASRLSRLLCRHVHSSRRFDSFHVDNLNLTGEQGARLAGFRLAAGTGQSHGADGNVLW